MRKGLPDLSRETSCLDDNFTAEELRIITLRPGWTWVQFAERRRR
jgi:hypothetical protein